MMTGPRGTEFRPALNQSVLLLQAETYTPPQFPEGREAPRWHSATQHPCHSRPLLFSPPVVTTGSGFTTAFTWDVPCHGQTMCPGIFGLKIVIIYINTLI